MRYQFIIFVVAATAMLSGCASKSKQDAVSLSVEASRLMVGEKYEQARERLRQATDLRPECAEYHTGIAICSVRLKDNRTALLHYAEAERLLEAQSQKDPERVDDYLMALLCQNKDEKASHELAKAKERFPGNKTVETVFQGYAEFAKGIVDLRIKE